MKVKFKKLSKLAKIPQYSKEGDAGMDLTATKIYLSGSSDLIYCDIDIAVEIPLGFVGLIYPRSSIKDTGWMLVNSVGVIDSGYRGPIKCVFRKIEEYKGRVYGGYKIGDRVAQLIITPYPTIELEEVDELSETDRGIGGFGSSGN